MSWLKQLLRIPSTSGVLDNRYKRWKKANPGKSFKDYYSYEVIQHLKKGGPHSTLGPHLKNGEVFGVSGSEVFQELQKLGLQKHHKVVDYGCGTLRIGVHVIRYIEKSCYYGMDVNHDLLEHGKILLGNGILDSKKPNLYVINQESVQFVGAVNPDYLISVAVVIHVHPDELAEYVSNISNLIGVNTKALITAKLGEKTVQYSGRSWVHSETVFKKLADHYGLKIAVLDRESWEHKNPHIIASRDTLLVTKK